MKKFIACLLMFIMVIVPMTGITEDTSFEVEEEEDHELAYSAFLLDENHELVGIKNAAELKIKLPFNCFSDGYLRGILDNGTVIRHPGMAKLQEFEGDWLGFTPLETTVTLFENTESLVESVVQNRVKTALADDFNIIAATVYFDKKYAGHIFYTKETALTCVGYVNVKDQKNPIALWLGDIDNNGEFELGFYPGYNQIKPTISPAPETTPETTEEVVLEESISMDLQVTIVKRITEIVRTIISEEATSRN